MFWESTKLMEATNAGIASGLLRLTLLCHSIDKHLAATAGVTVDEMHCLSQLHQEQPACVKRLSELLNASPTRTSKILKHLERRGFVTRTLHPEDRRKELVTLTDGGKIVAGHIVYLSSEAIQSFVCPLARQLPGCVSN
jgi:DNA-binding MarR family transcriptional regulator